MSTSMFRFLSSESYFVSNATFGVRKESEWFPATSSEMSFVDFMKSNQFPVEVRLNAYIEKVKWDSAGKAYPVDVAHNLDLATAHYAGELARVVALDLEAGADEALSIADTEITNAVLAVVSEMAWNDLSHQSRAFSASDGFPDYIETFSDGFSDIEDDICRIVWEGIELLEMDFTESDVSTQVEIELADLRNRILYEVKAVARKEEAFAEECKAESEHERYMNRRESEFSVDYPRHYPTHFAY